VEDTSTQRKPTTTWSNLAGGLSLGLNFSDIWGVNRESNVTPAKLGASGYCWRKKV